MKDPFQPKPVCDSIMTGMVMAHPCAGLRGESRNWEHSSQSVVDTFLAATAVHPLCCSHHIPPGEGMKPAPSSSALELCVGTLNQTGFESLPSCLWGFSLFPIQTEIPERGSRDHPRQTAC